jgi:CHRD domain-containing protein
MECKKPLYLVLLIGALFALLIVSTYSNYSYAQNKFRAKLEADNEVPPVDSDAKGVATFKVKGDIVKSKLNITGITDVSGAQILLGNLSNKGDPIVDLLATAEESQRTGGVSIKGNFTAADFQGPMKGKALSELQSAMASNQTYVNIMTSNHTNGELSGHIYAKGFTTGAQNRTAVDDSGVTTSN